MEKAPAGPYVRLADVGAHRLQETHRGRCLSFSFLLLGIDQVLNGFGNSDLSREIIHVGDDLDRRHWHGPMC
jgi:hypothetical protein